MTDTVVTQANDTAVIATQTVNQVVTDERPATIIVTGIMGPPVAANITNSGDVDITNLHSGSVLVYNTSTNKWVATNLLDQQTIEAGQF
jgi:hypothetical protein